MSFIELGQTWGLKMEDPSSKLMNPPQVVLSIFKCVVGTGSFFLPLGIKQGGLWGGAVGLVAMGLLTIYLNWIILGAKFKVFGNRPASYYDLALHVGGRPAGIAMYFSLCFANIGSCSVYIVTVSTLLLKLTSVFSNQVWFVFFAIAQLLISWLPFYSYLSYTSIIGDLGLAIAIFAVLLYGFQNSLIQPLDTYPALVVDTYAYFFATAAFLYIQPTTFFPISNATANPASFNYYSTVAYMIIIIVNTAFATIAYMFFGDNIDSNVLTNICPETLCAHPFSIIAHAALVIDVLFTFPLVLATVHEVLESSIFYYTPRDDDSVLLPVDHDIQKTHRRFPMEYSLIKRNILRTGVVFLCWALAAAIPNVGDLLGIISGIAITFNAFVLGPLIHLKLKFDEHSVSEMKRFSWLLSLILHTFIILFGAGIGWWSAYLSVISVISDFTQ